MLRKGLRNGTTGNAPHAGPRNVAAAAQSACVVGAGPAGLLTAAALAKRGMSVTVFEQRDLKSVSTPTSRSFALWVTGRSQKALDELGLHLPVFYGSDAVPVKNLLYGQARMPVDVVMGFTDERKTYCVERHRLVSELMDAANSLPAGAGHIDWHFGYQLAELDLDKRTATFEVSKADNGSAGDSSQPITLQYDLIVGADGANSAVRARLERSVPGFRSKVLYKSVDTWWKSFAGVDLSPMRGHDAQRPGLVDDKPLEAMYAFLGKPYAPSRPAPAFSCWKSLDGTFGGAFVLSPRFDEAFVQEQVATALPGAPAPIITSIVSQLKEGGARQANKSNTIIQVSQMHGPRCVILGDAAHTVTSTLGQGLNSSLESALALARTWDEVGGDLDALPAAFNAKRLQDVHALQTLDLIQLMAARPLDFPETSPVMLALAKALVVTGMWSTKLLGKGSPAHINTLLMTRIARKDVSYAEVLREFVVDASAVALVAGAGVALLGAGAYAVAAKVLFA